MRVEGRREEEKEVKAQPREIFVARGSFLLLPDRAQPSPFQHGYIESFFFTVSTTRTASIDKFLSKSDPPSRVLAASWSD